MTSLEDTLLAPGPHPSLGVHADTYGRFVGSWRGTLEDLRPDGATGPHVVEACFAWVLDGRAVQDTWITPPRDARTGAAALDWYGTTLRVFDPQTSAWAVTWFNPVAQHRMELSGRRQGDDVVQLGLRFGRPIRWTFGAVTPRAFRWQAHVLDLDGVRWLPEIDVRFTRQAPR